MFFATLIVALLMPQAEEPEASKYLFRGEFAYSLEREMPVCEKPVKYVFVSDKVALALLQGEEELHLFNVDKGTCKKVYSLAGSSEVRANLGDEFGVVELVVDSTPFVVQITFDGKSRTVARNARAATTADGSRTAVLFTVPSSFAILQRNGRLSPTIELPKDAYLDLQPNGEFAETESGKRYVYSRSTSEWVPVTDRPTYKRPDGPGAAVTGSKVIGRHFEKELLSAIFVVDAYNSTPPLFIAAGVDAVYKVAESAVLIQRGAALTMRKLSKEPAGIVLKRIADWERTEAMHAAEEMGRHFKLYADRNGGSFPARGADLGLEFFYSSREGGPDPRFVYEFVGGVPTEALSNILLGYISAPSGRAELYADGRVTWVPRK